MQIGGQGTCLPLLPAGVTPEVTMLSGPCFLHCRVKGSESIFAKACPALTCRGLSLNRGSKTRTQGPRRGQPPDTARNMESLLLATAHALSSPSPKQVGSSPAAPLTA